MKNPPVYLGSRCLGACVILIRAAAVGCPRCACVSSSDGLKPIVSNNAKVRRPQPRGKLKNGTAGYKSP